MKSTLSSVNTVLIIILFLVLTSSKIPWLFFTAFVLLLARGIHWFVLEMNTPVAVNEDQPKSNVPKLVVLRCLLILLPLLYTTAVMYIFFSRKEWWYIYFQ
ncbi:MAG: hypothetical protein NTW29_08730 [Bacteroidetes bacterium]|nr:hypothetical protein [Bacteroidota bacterium]